MEKEKRDFIKQRFARNGLIYGRCFGSKTNYRAKHKNNLFIPNARIYDKKTFEKEKRKFRVYPDDRETALWYGDLDLNKDIKILRDIAKESKLELVVCWENGNWITKMNPNI